MDAEHRQSLEQEWVDLVDRLLPEAAARQGWPLRERQNLRRVFLDNACHGVWQDCATGQPAHRHASDAVLLDAVTLARATLAGRADIVRLNRQSLRWRAARIAT